MSQSRPSRVCADRRDRAGRSGLLRAVLLIALTTSLAVSAIAPAAAGPEQDKTRVERKLTHAHSDYDESTSDLVKASAALTRAKAALAAARADLAAVQQDLVVARAKDAAARRQLEAATAAETTAALRAEQATTEVSQQRLQIAQFANATYQNGPLSPLSVIVGARSTDDLLSAMQVIATVSGSQVVALSRYTSARTQMSLRLADARHTEVVATALRNEAATALLHVRHLEARQQAQTAKVARLVAGRVEKQRAAARARAGALRQIRELERERATITARLRAIARRRAAEERRRAAERAAEHKAPAPLPVPSGGGLFGRPVNGPITSPFGLRFHPILHYWRLHDGMDFGVACGTPLYAARSGRVVAAYYGGGYGNRVIIDHGWLHGASMSTSYNHMTRFIVHAGQQLSRGQLIGYSGTTGLSTGCHLHFMVYRNGTPVNPANYL